MQQHPLHYEELDHGSPALTRVDENLSLVKSFCHPKAEVKVHIHRPRAAVVLLCGECGQEIITIKIGRRSDACAECGGRGVLYKRKPKTAMALRPEEFHIVEDTCWRCLGRGYAYSYPECAVEHAPKVGCLCRTCETARLTSSK
jgi:DNA-directed RNA polymerase subunit RPC12/RpoP